MGHGLVALKGLVNYQGSQLYMCWWCKAHPLVKTDRDRILEAERDR